MRNWFEYESTYMFNHAHQLKASDDPLALAAMPTSHVAPTHHTANIGPAP